MLRRQFSTLLALLATAALAPALEAQAPEWQEIAKRKPPLHAFTPQQPQRLVLPNGLVIFLQEDHELPLISASLRIRGGSREEPADKVGLVSLYGQTWRTGGTRTRSGDELDDFLEARGARVETGGGIDSTYVGFNCLKDDFADVLPVFMELLRTPEFRNDKLELAKRQLNTSIARRNDEPSEIAYREHRRVGYGSDSPYARIPEYATVAAVTREDLLAWHARYTHPNNMLLGVSGDFDARQMAATLRAQFGGWAKGPAAPKPSGSFPGPRPGPYLIRKDDVNQSNIRLVHLGATRDNPDFYALEVMNEVLSGGFASRLFSNLRSKKGLAYSVYGAVGMDFDHPGLFQASIVTNSGATARAIDGLIEEMDALKKAPVMAEELTVAKDGLLNAFVFRIDSKQRILSEKMTYEFYGYPLDLLEKYRPGIEKVTAEDVLRVSQKYLHPDRLALVVVGNEADFDRPLSSYGPVTAIDITIPEPAPKAQPAAAKP
jgi:zinc protease